MEGGAPSSILLLLSAMQSVYRRLGAHKMSARSVRHWALFVSIAAIFPSQVTPRPAPLPPVRSLRTTSRKTTDSPCSVSPPARRRRDAVGYNARIVVTKAQASGD